MRASQCLPFNVDQPRPLSPTIGRASLMVVILWTDWLDGRVVIVYCWSSGGQQDLAVPVCKIETFLALIVMLIVSLASLTTGAREASSTTSDHERLQVDQGTR